MVVKVLPAKPDKLSLIPGTHVIEERTNSYVVSSDFHIWHDFNYGICPPSFLCTHTHLNKYF